MGSWIVKPGIREPCQGWTCKAGSCWHLVVIEATWLFKVPWDPLSALGSTACPGKQFLNSTLLGHLWVPTASPAL